MHWCDLFRADSELPAESEISRRGRFPMDGFDIVDCGRYAIDGKNDSTKTRRESQLRAEIKRFNSCSAHLHVDLEIQVAKHQAFDLGRRANLGQRPESSCGLDERHDHSAIVRIILDAVQHVRVVGIRCSLNAYSSIEISIIVPRPEGCRCSSAAMMLLTSSSPSTCGCRARRGKDGDSFCKTATSRREKVHCRIDIAMMIRATLAAGPFPYSKPFPTLRAGASVTANAGLG